MLKRWIIKNQNFIKYLGCIVLTTFLLVILLYDQAYKTLYIVCLSSAFCSVLIGDSNYISKLKLGLGITRKEIEKRLLKDLMLLILNSIVLIGFNILFIYIVLNTFDIQLRIVVFTFLVSLNLSFLSLFIKNNIENKKTAFIVLIISLVIMIFLYFISNKIIANIVLIILIVILYLVNRYNIYHKDIK